MPKVTCKMCGGSITAAENAKTEICEFCGTEQTIPVVSDERRLSLFNRANTQRLNNEYDAAIVTFQSLLIDNPNDPEAHFGIVLCKYGIEYVDDPKTGKKIPTCHRADFKSVFEDNNYKLAITYADAVSRKLYKKLAIEIDSIQKGILSISQKEEPYDVFICYKETDFNGNRTEDSVYAYEIYEELIKRGYRVFFSRVTLESKLGEAYEPIIFAALNSAKVMIAIGTRKEFFNATWVKNEWSRFLSMIARDGNKYLIPCFKNMNPYDMPLEFKYLQSQDMSKIGYMQDLIRGVEKLLGNKTYIVEDKENNIDNNVDNSVQQNIDDLIKRCRNLISQRAYRNTYALIDEIFFYDPENAYAYIFKLLIQKSLTDESEIPFIERIYANEYFIKSLRYAKGDHKRRLQSIKDSSLETEYIKFLELLKTGKRDKIFKFVDEHLREYKDVGLIIDSLKDNVEKVFDKRKIANDYMKKLKVYLFENSYYNDLVVAYKLNKGNYICNDNSCNVALSNKYNYEDLYFIKDDNELKWIAVTDKREVEASYNLSIPKMMAPIGIEKYTNSIIYKKFDGKYIPTKDIYIGGRKNSPSQYDNYMFAFRKVKKLIVELGHPFIITNDNELVSSSLDRFKLENIDNIVDIHYYNDTLYALLDDGTVLIQQNGSNVYTKFEHELIVYIGDNYNMPFLKGNHHVVDMYGNAYILETGERINIDNVSVIIDGGIYINNEGIIGLVDKDNVIDELRLLEGLNVNDEVKMKNYFDNQAINYSKDIIKLQYQRQNKCIHCGGAFKGIFKKICKSCGMKKDY